MSDQYYIMDLERTILSGIVHYWNQNKHGYCNDLASAGVFTYKQSKDIVEADFDKRTIMIDKQIVERMKG